MNLPPPPPSQPVPSEEAAVAKLLAWYELKAQMAQLHAQLQCLQLMLKLGVGAR